MNRRVCVIRRFVFRWPWQLFAPFKQLQWNKPEHEYLGLYGFELRLCVTSNTKFGEEATGGSSILVELEFENVGFTGGMRPGEKHLQNWQYIWQSGRNRTWTTLVEGEHSHHCAILPTQQISYDAMRDKCTANHDPEIKDFAHCVFKNLSFLYTAAW